MAATLAGWHDLYVTVGAAAATLVGLPSVGLSLHVRVVVAHDRWPQPAARRRRAVARRLGPQHVGSVGDGRGELWGRRPLTGAPGKRMSNSPVEQAATRPPGQGPRVPAAAD